MLNLLQAEVLKSRRTFARKLVIGAPLFFVLYAIAVKMLMPDGQLSTWEALLAMVFNWWSVLFVPLGTALLCALTEARERKSGAERSLRARPVSPRLLWLAKAAVLAGHTLLSSAMLVFSTLLAGLLIAEGPAPLGRILVASAAVWVLSTALIPLQLLAAAWKGTALSLLLGLAGLFAGVLSAPRPHWLAVPWSWPTRAMAPLIGVHPNGVPLPAGDPLFDRSVIPLAIGLALAFLAVSLLLTAICYARREVR
ncbi:lantibiotic immunity ABC transporter MutE/EpiE family permease subunit [Paenibacillus ginsengihumi]|uniref:lantibiotic immunity ABC transporter MutE/EpiE family permease subunit n=1 Tax=Paenibacillus ginsengihumi TaxID=431596 RepID=UPI00035FB6DA|nr:lantibiotic immunity ABC transporter MutE/EpiE family permease subunit [Paenibacillus ginsengihumi]